MKDDKVIEANLMIMVSDRSMIIHGTGMGSNVDASIMTVEKDVVKQTECENSTDGEQLMLPCDKEVGILNSCVGIAGNIGPNNCHSDLPDITSNPNPNPNKNYITN